MKVEGNSFCFQASANTFFERLPEDIPKPKSLITSASDDGLSVRGHCQVENSVAVTC